MFSLKSICLKNIVEVFSNHHTSININDLDIPNNLKIDLFKQNSKKFSSSNRENLLYCEPGRHFKCLKCNNCCKNKLNLTWLCDNKTCTVYRQLLAIEDFKKCILYIQRPKNALIYLVEEEYFCTFCGKFEENKNNLYTLCISSHNMNDDFPKCSFKE